MKTLTARILNIPWRGMPGVLQSVIRLTYILTKTSIGVFCLATLASMTAIYLLVVSQPVICRAYPQEQVLNDFVTYVGWPVVTEMRRQK